MTRGFFTMNIDATGEQTVVIVGVGLAGGNAAVTLREEGWRGRIVLLGAEPGIPFGRPPLSKTYLRGEEDLNAWYVKPTDWYGDHDVELRTGSTVRQVDTALKQLRLASGETVDYDKLVLCTGGRNRRFEVPGASLPGVYQLRTLAECDAIRQVARPGARAVVIGMGFIGSEVAASLRQMGLEVTVVLPGAAPLSTVLGNEVFAAGDVANLLHPVFGRVRVEHFNNAEKQGRAVARAVLGTLEAYEYIYSFWSDQYEHKLEYVGFARSWERIVLRGSYDSRKFLAFYLTQGVLQAACGLNRGGDPELEADAELSVCQDLIHGRIRLSETALADDRVDLRSLNPAPRNTN